MRRLSDDLWVSGQIQPADLPDLAARGVVMVVNHRPDGEAPGQPLSAALEGAAADAGVAYVAIPVRGAPGPEAARATADALADATGPALMFCRSGMRSTAAWAMGQVGAGRAATEVRAQAATAGYDLSGLPL